MPQQLPEAAAELLRTPLTVKQRLELIGELWDSIPDSVEALPIPDWHREELERRLAAADADPEAAIPYDCDVALIRAEQVVRRKLIHPLATIKEREDAPHE